MNDLTSLPLLVYAGLYTFAAIDVVLPIVPSESAVIAAGVLAAQDRISLSLVMVAAAAGAVTGDVLGYLLGRRYGERLVRRVLRRQGGRELAWSQSALRQNEAWVLLTARFIPVGRTAATMESGYLRLPSRR